MQKILLVEDEPSIADTLLFALKKESFESLHVSTISEAKNSLSKEKFNAIILDVGLPDGSGFDFCKEIRKESNIPILFLTARDDEIDRIVGLEIGADDYVTKPFSPREVTARIKAILRRSSLQTETETQNVHPLFNINHNKRLISFKGSQIELSRYEFGILEMLIRRPGFVFSRQQIMETVWEEPDMSLERTVDTHVKTIRSKIKEIDDSEEYIITHRGIGYSLKE